MTEYQAEVTVNNFTVMRDIGRRLEQLTDIWFGPSDIAGAFWVALRAADAAACIIEYNGATGLTLSPDVAVGVAEAINEELVAGVIEADQVRRAVEDVMLEKMGFMGGVVIVWRDGSVIKLNVAEYREAKVPQRTEVLN